MLIRVYTCQITTLLEIACHGSFICVTCKCFSQAGHLKKHKMMTHSMDEPYNCNMCDQQFTLATDLTKPSVFIQEKSHKAVTLVVNVLIHHLH